MKEGTWERQNRQTRPATAWPQTAIGPHGLPGAAGPLSRAAPALTRRQWRVLGLVAMASF